MFNSKIMWFIYFTMPIILFAVVAEPSPIGALNRTLSEQDGYMFIPFMLFFCGLSFAVGKFFIADRIMLQISNKELYYNKQRVAIANSEKRREALDNFFLNTIPGCIIEIIVFSWMAYEFLFPPDAGLISGLFGIYFLLCAGMAISRFISLSAKNK